MMNSLKASQIQSTIQETIMADALKVGDQAPDFALMDETKTSSNSPIFAARR
jgi:hypothetical protein